MSQFMLVCAVIASLAAGVWLAQGLCVLMFHVFRIHARQVAATRVSKPQVGSQTQPVGLPTLQG
jgi:hypothetical protein